MTLTHFLALFGAAPALIVPAAALLPLADGGAVVGSNRADPALLPGIIVRTATPVLIVRGD